MRALKTFTNVVTEMLREIFDENAYSRFLLRESKRPTAEAYAEFMEQKYETPVQRCC